jgi:preprotein translocase subunit SecE
MADNIKLFVAVVIMMAAIVLFYTFEEYSTLLRVLSLLAAAGLSVFIALKTKVGGGALAFLGETQTEVRKVVWPTRQETVQTTLVVMLMVTLVAILLWGVDSLLGWVVSALIS